MSTETPTPLLYQIKRVELAIRKHLDAVLETHGLTTIQYTALTSLARQPGMTVASLARHSFVAAQTMAQLVGTLADRGWIARESDPGHRRRLLVVLTPEGRDLLADLSEPVAEVERRMVAGVPDDDLAAVRSALRAFGTALELPGRPAGYDRIDGR